MTKNNSSLFVSSKHSAFTLIELIFVLVLLGLLGSIVAPRVANITGLSNKTNVLKMAGFFQRAHQMAVLRSKNFRVVMDMDEKKFWVEEQVPMQTKPLLPDEFKVDDVILEFRKEADTYNDDEEIEKRKNALYAKYEEKGLEPLSLPSPLYVESVYFSGLDERINQGAIYIPISSTGYHPTIIIYIAHKDEIKYSLVYPSLSSKVRLEKGEIAPEEIQW